MAAAGKRLAAAAADGKAVRAFLDPGSDRGEGGGRGGDAVRFLDPQLAEPAGAGLAVGKGGGDEEDREIRRSSPAPPRAPARCR